MEKIRLGKIILVSLILTALFYSQSFAWDGTGPLIIDHTAVQKFDHIPDYWIDRAKELIVHYGHTSHGSQVVAGLNWIEANLDPIKYKLKANLSSASDYRDPFGSRGIPSQEHPPALLMWEEGAHPEGYWQGQSAIDATIGVLDTGALDISGWSWCGEHGNAAIINDYISSMVTIENACPDVIFFYMTGVTSPYRTQYNDMIRTHCGDNNRVLFDFADIEKHDPDGGYHGPDGRGDWCAAWISQNPGRFQNIPPTVETGGGGDGWLNCSHAHGLYAIMKGRAFWYMMARIAGWDGVETEDPPDDPELGDVNGDGYIEAYDASITARHAAQLIGLSTNQRNRADVNADGVISAADAAAIARHAAGVITNF